MCGWLTRAAARASRRNRSRAPLIGQRLGPNDLDGHRPIESIVVRGIDDAHAPLAEHAGHLIPADSLHEPSKIRISPDCR